jgi:hypothetical protein
MVISLSVDNWFIRGVGLVGGCVKGNISRSPLSFPLSIIISLLYFIYIVISLKCSYLVCSWGRVSRGLCLR